MKTTSLLRDSFQIMKPNIFFGVNQAPDSDHIHTST